ncbi:MAG: thiamine diphosphokinase [Candidatus Electryonea clarkiae]|nr:thiamine diphosphokinase [Candidatus Electryonea clarkiae]MDP8287060.1 thiamine diphosphokinase [Candidatus Electryonea clarkiae]
MTKKIIEPVLIVLNGDIPLSILEGSFFQKYSYIIAVDGALDKLLEKGIMPHAVTGDFDSVSEVVLKELQFAGGEIIHQAEQNSTDFEKTLNLCKSKGFRQADVIGFSGSRIDHNLSVWDAALRFSRHIKLKFIDQIAESFIITDAASYNIDKKSGHICSIIPLLPCNGVSLSGFNWSIDDEEFALGRQISSSNEILDETAVVSLESGALLIVLHNEPDKTP